MLISRAKRKSNMAEYILYMWQVEDTIRAFDFDTVRIEKELISKFDQPDEIRMEMKEWYENLAASMRMENVMESGHVSFLRNHVNELYKFHLALLQKADETQYAEMYAAVMPLIQEMNARQKWSAGNEIETCLSAVYIYLMMKLKKDPVTSGTSNAMEMFIRFLGVLSQKFREWEEEE